MRTTRTVALIAVLAAGLMSAPVAAAAPPPAPRPPGHTQPVPSPPPAARPQPPSHVRVPTLAFDESSVSLVWNKPPRYGTIVDYRIYQNGRLIGSAGTTSGAASLPAIDAFYADPANAAQVKIVMNNFMVTGLRPDTKYRFTVRSVDANGVESRDSAPIAQQTARVAAVFNIGDYGAIGDGTTLNTQAIQRAIDAATKGATVRVPAGVFKTGALWLKSNMTLEVAAGGTLLGSENADDYAYHYRLYDYSTDERFYSLINAQSFGGKQLENIRIVGGGTIDGNGWKQIGVDADGYPASAPSSSSTVAANGILAASQVKLAALLGSPAPYPTRSNLITLRGVNNVYYHGFTALNPSNHTLVNLESNNVTVNGVKLLTYDANNADGIEFAHGNGLTVYNTLFDTGDDCMNFAAGLGQQSVNDPPTQNAWIFNNYFRRGHGAVVAGSHTGALIENVTAEDNVMNKTDIGLRMKTNPTNGGGARNFLFRDNAMKDMAAQAFIFTSAYLDPNAAIAVEPAATPGYFRDIRVENVTVDGVKKASIQVDGLDGQAHRDIHFENVHFLHATKTSITQLQDSSFENVVFDDVVDPWVIKDSRDLVFPDGTTSSAVSLDASQAPRWPVAAKTTVVPSDTSVALSWPAATDNTAVAAYRVFLNGRLAALVAGGTTSAVVTGSAPQLAYKVEVRAYDATGNTRAPIAAAFTTMGPKDIGAPAVPQGADAIAVSPVGGAVGSTWASISWQPASDIYGVYSYELTVAGKAVLTVPGDQLTATVGGLVPDTASVLGVTAVDATGNATVYPVTLTVTTTPYPPMPTDPRLG
jgi:exo-poly-alpha-galacturonosidase